MKSGWEFRTYQQHKLRSTWRRNRTRPSGLGTCYAQGLECLARLQGNKIVLFCLEMIVARGHDCSIYPGTCRDEQSELPLLKAYGR